MFESKIIKEEFERNLLQIKVDPFESAKLISFKEILKAHFLIIDYFSSLTENITYGVKDFNLLGSTLGRQLTGFGAYQKWKKPEEVCATLFYGVVKNHAFHDANKRTALLTLVYHLLKYGRTINAKQKDFEDLALCLASDSLNEYRAFRQNRYQRLADKEIYFIADFIRRHTREIEKKYYPVTYQEFDRLLRRQGFRFEISNDGFVDVIGDVMQKKYFGLIRQKYQKRYIQVGFPGWKRQINPKAVKEIFKATGLTAENGVDSKVFFWEAEPLTGLIDQYKYPLIRLKDK